MVTTKKILIEKGKRIKSKHINTPQKSMNHREDKKKGQIKELQNRPRQLTKLQ